MKSLNRKRKIIIAVILILTLFLTWIIWTNLAIKTTDITIENNKIPEEFNNFKIAQVSDLHNRKLGDRLIKIIQNESPDIIVVTGDLVDSSHTDFDTAMEFIDSAMKIAPVYYVTGNHEAWLNNFEDLEKRLTDSGVHMLDNKCQWLTKGDAKINIAGVKDPDFIERTSLDGIQGAIVTESLKPLLNNEYYNIVLSHRPELFEEYVNMQADLVLTGHAHGGQVRIPFVGGLIAPNQGLFPHYTEGVYSKDNTDMVVSRGLGNSVISVRINNTPELFMITLKKS